jgi:hypothetical protein
VVAALAAAGSAPVGADGPGSDGGSEWPTHGDHDSERTAPDPDQINAASSLDDNPWAPQPFVPVMHDTSVPQNWMAPQRPLAPVGGELSISAIAAHRIMRMTA